MSKKKRNRGNPTPQQDVPVPRITEREESEGNSKTEHAKADTHSKNEMTLIAKWRFGIEVSVAFFAFIGAMFLYRQLALMQEQMHASERPWIVPAENPIGGPKEELLNLGVGKNRFYVWMFNGGGSPALETRSFGCASVGPNPPVSCSSPASSGGGVIGPGMKMWINFSEFDIGPEQMDQIRHGEWHLWVVARVAYTDQLESTLHPHPHETGMCLYSDLGPGASGGWKPCGTGNYAR